VSGPNAPLPAPPGGGTRRPRGYDPVLLDLDGTVIDSVALIRESHRHAVRTVLGEELEDERLVANVGRPLLEQMAAFSPERSEELYRVYREWNHANTAALLLAYPDIPAALRELREAGRRLGIVTSKSRDAVELAWQVLPEMEELFDAVVAAEDSERHKPAPDPVLLALERLGGGPEGACYVGDSPFDIESGRAAGVFTIGVTWGFFSRPALEEAGADLIVDTPAAMVRACLGAA
jgi:pyrophosphatase PpaX